ncbi:MAG: diaminobutyrate--2-oxoglutarate transaminase [Candidatus Methylomirabilis sp.]|nr:diaminobutyrate--2-oxoglutarate transaminase [Deltaproteobacteria bacterium]
MKEIEKYESKVRSYCRSFPVVFDRAEGADLYDTDGRRYVDFFSGAGALNYGHNDPGMRDRLIEYLSRGAIVHGLDMATVAKQDLLERFDEVILKPRGLSYKVQFPGPTGTNSVEAALKLARKVTGREKIVSFTNAFHGMTLGSLSMTGNAFKRQGAGVSLTMSLCMPFEGYFGDEVDTIEYIDRLIEDSGSGVDQPAAAIVETVQAEGGVNVASDAWLRRLEELCRRHDMLLIVDDIQVGCGRTGPFFSFERAGVRPDIVCLSKSLSGFGLPLAFTLIKPELDCWEPGEHNGTFRGHNPAFVTATEALRFWKDDALTRAVEEKGAFVRDFLETIAREKASDAPLAQVRGRGLIQGIDLGSGEVAGAVCREAFRRGLVIETSGPESNVVKALPPLTIDRDCLEEGLDILAKSMDVGIASARAEARKAAGAGR